MSDKVTIQRDILVHNAGPDTVVVKSREATDWLEISISPTERIVVFLSKDVMRSLHTALASRYNVRLSE